MRLPCPFCGSRDIQEFVYRGDADRVRPGPDGDFHAYLYERDNVAGPVREHWYHAQGCRNWLVVTRDTVTHAIHHAAFARDVSR